MTTTSVVLNRSMIFPSLLAFSNENNQNVVDDVILMELPFVLENQDFLFSPTQNPVKMIRNQNKFLKNIFS